MALFVHRSNRTEVLVDLLAEVLTEPLCAPLAPEYIAVQGSGMERWLTGQLAARFGVWAQPCFPFPRAAAELVLDAFLGRAPESRARFDLPQLTLRVASALPKLLDDADFARFRAYLDADPGRLRLLALASELASAFDRYAVYRPDFLRAFERGEGDAAQGKLWCSVSDGARDAHFAARVHALMQAARDTRPNGALPERLSLFGLSALAPSLLTVFRAAALHVPVHAFLLVPVRDYYDDIDRNERHRRDATGLVGRFGRMIRELDHDLRALEGPDVSVTDRLVTPTAEHALAYLQGAMLALGDDEERHTLHANDDSLRVNVCTSKTRELEVLRDELRARFEQTPALEPRDVVVLVPDIESYALAIDSVFRGETGEQAIPFRIADTSATRNSDAAAALFTLLDLMLGRFTSAEFIDAIHAPKVRACFRLDDEDLALFERWLDGAGARFGLDEAQRTLRGQGGGDAHTLMFALDRLLLALTLPDLALGAFANVVPAPTVEGKSAERLGKLARVLRTLQQFTLSLGRPARIAQHAQSLIDLVDRMLDGARGDDAFANAIKQRLARIAADSISAGADALVDARAVISLLRAELEGGGMASAFLSGAVTFCQHMPMRAIPFRMLCMLGMDETAFPRPAREAQLDLGSAQPRRGDRNARDDDRQLFLDALLCARDALLLSYVSEAETSHEPRGPSSAIAHLVRALSAHVRVEDVHGLEARIVRVHGRLAFDARYFSADGEAEWRSFDTRALALLRTWLGPKRELRPFVENALPADEQEAELPLDTLVRFFKHPQRAFLNQRLGVRLWNQSEVSAGREPVTLEALGRFTTGERVLHTLSELPPEQRAHLLSRTGELPKGMLGTVQLKWIEHTSTQLKEAAMLGAARGNLRIAVPLPAAETVLVGQLDRMHERGRRLLVYGALNEKRLLAAWIEHVAYAAYAGAEACTVLVGRDKKGADVIGFAPVPDAHEALSALVALWQEGMTQPLPFFPAASYAYAYARHSQKSHEDALIRAQKAFFEQAGDVRAPAADPYVKQAFGTLAVAQLAALSGGAPDVAFVSLAMRIFGPMLRATKEFEKL